MPSTTLDDLMYAFRDIFFRINIKEQNIFLMYEKLEKKKRTSYSYRLKKIYLILAGNKIYFTVKFV